MAQLGDKDKLVVRDAVRLMNEHSISIDNDPVYMQLVEVSGAVTATTAANIVTSLGNVSAVLPSGKIPNIVTDLVLSPNDDVSFNGNDIASTASAEAITCAAGMKQYKKLSITPQVGQGSSDKTVFTIFGTK